MTFIFLRQTYSLVIIFFLVFLISCDDPTITSDASGCESLSAPCPEGSECRIDAVGNPFCAIINDLPLAGTINEGGAVVSGEAAGVTQGGEQGGINGGDQAGTVMGGSMNNLGGEVSGDVGGNLGGEAGTNAGDLLNGGDQVAGTSGGTSGGSPAVSCDTLELALKPSTQGTPQVMLVVDRSYSMIDREDRWTPALRAMSAVTQALEENVAFGLTLFPDPLGRLGAPEDLNQCTSWGRDSFFCEEDLRACVPGRVFIDPAVNTSLEIREILAGQGPRPNQGTPTYSALLAAAESLENNTNLISDKIIILVTDGLPGCNYEINPRQCDCLLTNLPRFCEIDNFSSMCLDELRVINEIESLASRGIKTLIVGMTIGLPNEGSCLADGGCPFGGQRCMNGTCVNLAPSVLSEMARAGGQPQGNYFSVNDVNDIEAQITRATASIAPCVFDMSNIPPELYEQLVVYVDGQVVPPDANRMNGWWAYSGVIEFFGPACDALRDGLSHRIAARCE